MNHSFGWFLVEYVREFASCLEFPPVFIRYIVEKNGQVVVIVVIVICIWDRDAPKSEFICGDIIESRSLSGFDEFLEVINSVVRRHLDGECIERSPSINKTKQAQAVVGHSIAKHQMKCKNERWRVRKEEKQRDEVEKKVGKEKARDERGRGYNGKGDEG